MGKVVKTASLAVKFSVSILGGIVQKKRERLSSAKRNVHLGQLTSRITEIDKPRDFKRAIKRGKGTVRLIAEIKKASPSRGLIRSDFDAVMIARLYENKAVDAVSVITEEDFFLGHQDFIPAVKEVVTRPVLRKDFLFDEYQVYESRAWGADAILLIAALLGRTQATEYLSLARELGMSVLFEVHDHKDLEKVLRSGAEIIGVNNRDLKTLAVDLNTSVRLKEAIPSDIITVSESGIRNREDVSRLDATGFDALLVGTVFMESQDIGRKIDELMR